MQPILYKKKYLPWYPLNSAISLILIVFLLIFLDIDLNVTRWIWLFVHAGFAIAVYVQLGVGTYRLFEDGRLFKASGVKIRKTKTLSFFFLLIF